MTKEDEEREMKYIIHWKTGEYTTGPSQIEKNIKERK
jgi:hypothetical protein